MKPLLTVGVIAFGLWSGFLLEANAENSSPFELEPLGSTRSKTTLMMCTIDRNKRTYTLAKFKPKRCAGLRADQSFAEGFNYGKLRWSSWGRQRATFRGVSLGFKLPPSNIKVSGKVYRPKRDRCGSSKMVFTRMDYRTRFGKATRSLRPCLGSSR